MNIVTESTTAPIPHITTPPIHVEKPVPRIVPVTMSGFPYYPDRQVIPAGVPTAVYLSVFARQITIQNNSGAVLYRKYTSDVSTASFQIPTTGTLFDTIRTEYVWLYSIAGTIVNPWQSDGAGINIEVYS